MKMLSVLLLVFSLAPGKAPFNCGEKKLIQRPYGQVTREVDCKYRKDNSLGVLEWKGKRSHGAQVHYDSLWRKTDSSFFLNGKKEGIVKFWDTAGNQIGSINYRNGKRVGQEEAYYGPGKLEFVKSYDDSGKEHGAWNEWWPNGAMRKDLTFNHGQLQRSLEFYPTGKPMLLYEVRFRESSEEGVYHRRVPTLQSWAPDGRPTGMVQDGKGEALIFMLSGDTLQAEVIREVYKDSVVIQVEALDTTKAYRRLDSLARIEAKKKP